MTARGGLPVTLSTVLKLPNLGVTSSCIKFGSCAMESDKFVTVCDSTGGSPQVFVIDRTARETSVTRHPISAEAAIMNPASKVLALRAGTQLQIFTLEPRTKKVKSHTMTAPCEFWRWTSPTTIALVTPQSVFHWSIDGPEPPVKVVERHFFSLSAREGTQITGYEVSPDGKWCLLMGGSQGAATMQLVSIEKGVSQKITGHAGCFHTLRRRGLGDPAPLVCFEEKKAGDSPAKLVVVDLRENTKTTPGGGLVFLSRSSSRKLFSRATATIPVPADAPTDSPVAMMASPKHDLLYVLTREGYLYLFDLLSLKVVCRARVASSDTTVFAACPETTTGGILGMTRKGELFQVSLNEEALVPYVAFRDHALGISLASRLDLPGADDLCRKEFDRRMATSDVAGAAEVAAEAPRGLLRTADTIQRFQALREQAPPHLGGELEIPLVRYFHALLDRGYKLTDLESLELARALIRSGQTQVLEKWLHEDKLECSDQLGDLLLQADVNLALSVYDRANVPETTIALVASGTSDENALTLTWTASSSSSSTNDAKTTATTTAKKTTTNAANAGMMGSAERPAQQLGPSETRNHGTARGAQKTTEADEPTLTTTREKAPPLVASGSSSPAQSSPPPAGVVVVVVKAFGDVRLAPDFTHALSADPVTKRRVLLDDKMPVRDYPWTLDVDGNLFATLDEGRFYAQPRKSRWGYGVGLVPESELEDERAAWNLLETGTITARVPNVGIFALHGKAGASDLKLVPFAGHHAAWAFHHPSEDKHPSLDAEDDSPADKTIAAWLAATTAPQQQQQQQKEKKKQDETFHRAIAEAQKMVVAETTPTTGSDEILDQRCCLGFPLAPEEDDDAGTTLDRRTARASSWSPETPCSWEMTSPASFRRPTSTGPMDRAPSPVLVPSPVVVPTSLRRSPSGVLWSDAYDSDDDTKANNAADDPRSPATHATVLAPEVQCDLAEMREWLRVHETTILRRARADEESLAKERDRAVLLATGGRAVTEYHDSLVSSLHALFVAGMAVYSGKLDTNQRSRMALGAGVLVQGVFDAIQLPISGLVTERVKCSLTGAINAADTAEFNRRAGKLRRLGLTPDHAGRAIADIAVALTRAASDHLVRCGTQKSKGIEAAVKDDLKRIVKAVTAPKKGVLDDVDSGDPLMVAAAVLAVFDDDVKKKPLQSTVSLEEKLRDDEVARLTSELSAATDAVAKIRDQMKDLQEAAASDRRTVTQLTELKQKVDLIATSVEAKKKPASATKGSGARQKVQCQVSIDEDSSAERDGSLAELLTPADLRSIYHNQDQIASLNHQVANLAESLGAISGKVEKAIAPESAHPTKHRRRVFRATRLIGRPRLAGMA